MFKQKQTTLPPPSVFHLVIIAAATAAERAGVVSSFLGVATTGNTGQGVTLVVHIDYKGDMKADRNGASGLPASLQFSWRFHAVGRQNSAVKVMFIGNQSKR